MKKIRVETRSRDVRGARSGAACAENAFVKAVKLGTVLLRLEALLIAKATGAQPRLNALVLRVEVAEVGHEVLDNLHVGEGKYPALAGRRVDL